MTLSSPSYEGANTPWASDARPKVPEKYGFVIDAIR